MRHVELARRLLFPRPLVDTDVDILDIVEDFLQTHPKTIIFDITLSRWGTVAVLFGGKGDPVGRRLKGSHARTENFENDAPCSRVAIELFLISPDTGARP